MYVYRKTKTFIHSNMVTITFRWECSWLNICDSCSGLHGIMPRMLCNPMVTQPGLICMDDLQDTCMSAQVWELDTTNVPGIIINTSHSRGCRTRS
jgi:hypothetical protein